MQKCLAKYSDVNLCSKKYLPLEKVTLLRKLSIFNALR